MTKDHKQNVSVCQMSDKIVHTAHLVEGAWPEVDIDNDVV